MLVYRGIDPNRIMEERILSGAAYPGQAVVRTASAKFIASAEVNSIYAILTDKMNKLDGSTLEGAYEDGDRVEGFVPRPGDPIEMILALSQTIVEGAELGLDATGFLKAASTGATAIGNATNYVTFTPLNGNFVSASFVDPSGNTQSLAVTISGGNIIVSLATNGAGAITSTPALIVAAYEAVSGNELLATAVATGTAAVIANAVESFQAGIVFAVADEAVTTTSSVLDTIKATVAPNQK